MVKCFYHTMIEIIVHKYTETVYFFNDIYQPPINKKLFLSWSLFKKAGMNTQKTVHEENTGDRIVRSDWN